MLTTDLLSCVNLNGSFLFVAVAARCVHANSALPHFCLKTCAVWLTNNCTSGAWAMMISCGGFRSTVFTLSKCSVWRQSAHCWRQSRDFLAIFFSCCPKKATQKDPLYYYHSFTHSLAFTLFVTRYCPIGRPNTSNIISAKFYYYFRKLNFDYVPACKNQRGSFVSGSSNSWSQ